MGRYGNRCKAYFGAWDFKDFACTRFQGSAGSEHIIYNEDVFSFQCFRFVY